MNVVAECGHGTERRARLDVLTGEQTELTGVAGGAEKVGNGSPGVGQLAEFVAADEEIDGCGRVESGDDELGGILFAGETKVEKDAFLRVDLFSNFAEMFEGGSEVLLCGGFIVKQCGSGCGSEFTSQQDLVRVDEVMATAAEELQLEGHSAEGEEICDTEGLIRERVRGTGIIEKDGSGRDRIDCCEPLAAVGAGIDDDMFLIAEDVSPLVGHPRFGRGGNEDDSSTGEAVLRFCLAEKRE